MNDNDNINNQTLAINEDTNNQTSAIKLNIHRILNPDIDPSKLDHVILEANHITYLAYHLVNFYVLQELSNNRSLAYMNKHVVLFQLCQ